MGDGSIQNKRYNNCICSFLTSGLTGLLRYRYEKIGQARVFYPYVCNEQLERFNKGQGIVPIERCKDKSSRDYADWGKFLQCFAPVGKVDRACDYLVYIADGKAGYVPLCGNIQMQKPIDSLKDKGGYYVDLQSLLLKGLSCTSNEFYGYSVFYRSIFNKGSFTFFRNPVPFDVLLPILQSGDFTKEKLFVDYSLNVVPAFSADEVQNYLDTSRKRFINAVSRHWKQDGVNDILNKEWCLHTRLLFERYAKQKHNAKQSHLIEMIIGYCNKRLKKTDLVSGKGGVPHLSFYNRSISVSKLYSALVREGYIPADTGEDAFTYYMIGEGDNVPAKRITWCGTNAQLIYFIFTVEGYGKCEWSIVSKIFVSSQSGELRADSLRTSFHKSYNYSKKRANQEYFADFVKNL